MAKRISRRELKGRIKDLQFMVKCKEDKIKEVEEKYKGIEKRFQEMGSQIETLNVQGEGIKCIEVKPQAWGTYAMLAPWHTDSEEAMEALKDKLVKNIAKGLIDYNYVQFIHKDDTSPFGETFAAKLYVVPWDKLAKRTIKIKTGE